MALAATVMFIGASACDKPTADISEPRDAPNTNTAEPATAPASSADGGSKAGTAASSVGDSSAIPVDVYAGPDAYDLDEPEPELEPVAPTVACETNDDCEQGEACADGRCSPA